MIATVVAEQRRDRAAEKKIQLNSVRE